MVAKHGAEKMKVSRRCVGISNPLGKDRPAYITRPMQGCATVTRKGPRVLDFGLLLPEGHWSFFLSTCPLIHVGSASSCSTAPSPGSDRGATGPKKSLRGNHRQIGILSQYRSSQFLPVFECWGAHVIADSTRQ